MFGWTGILIGILLILFGGYMIFLFPDTERYQTAGFTRTGMAMGLLSLLIGAVLLFVQ
jgi:hypothetical protein